MKGGHKATFFSGFQTNSQAINEQPFSPQKVTLSPRMIY
jgi:hypothetical protein